MFFKQPCNIYTIHQSTRKIFQKYFIKCLGYSAETIFIYTLLTQTHYAVSMGLLDE